MTKPIAVQLYSLREEIKNDLMGIMTKLASIGYIGVEPYADVDHKAVATACKEVGLKVISSHLPPPIGDTKAATLEAAEIYGIEKIIIPWMDPSYFESEGTIKRLCDTLNAAEKVAKENGLILGYHNHDFEFSSINGTAPRIFAEYLSPSIFFEIDTYWVQVGGHDVPELLTNLGTRAPLLHIKDGPAVKGTPMTAVGDGVMDVPAIVAAGGDSIEWLIVELDACATDMMEAVEKSYHYMINEGLAHGK